MVSSELLMLLHVQVYSARQWSVHLCASYSTVSYNQTVKFIKKLLYVLELRNSIVVTTLLLSMLKLLS